MITPKPELLKALIVVHRAMLAAQILFALVAFYIVYKHVLSIDSWPNLNGILQLTAIGFTAAGFYLGNFLFKKKVLRARAMRPGVREKFELYRSACITQWALIEGPCLFVIICFLLTGNYAFLTLAAVLILLFTMLAPSKIKIAFQLKLSEQEIAEL